VLRLFLTLTKKKLHCPGCIKKLGEGPKFFGVLGVLNFLEWSQAKRIGGKIIKKIGYFYFVCKH